MRPTLTPRLNPQALAALLALALAVPALLAAPGVGPGPAWAQEDVEADDPTGGDEPEAEVDPTSEAEDAPADPATTEGAPVEPTDAADGADEAGTDASGNTSDDPNPALDPARGEEVQEEALVGGRDLPVIGQPVHGGINFQPASSEVARDQQALDGFLNWVSAIISAVVMVLLGWVIVRYGARRNPVPARFTHNSPLEVAWTIIPIIILVFVGAFSLPVLFRQQEIPEADIHIKATGLQWFWNYEYLDEGVAFDSYMIGYGQPPMTDAPDDPVRLELEAAGFSDEQYKLATDTALVLPTGATVVMTITGADVIHSWALPAMGVKQDAVPGRLAQAWFNTETEGVYFGQCSELCGKDHAYMPIQVRVVSPEAYAAWLEGAREEFGV